MPVILIISVPNILFSWLQGNMLILWKTVKNKNYAQNTILK